MKSTVDLSVLRISAHAVDQYLHRIMCRPLTFHSRGAAKRRLAALLHYAEPLPSSLHKGIPYHAWKLAGCVALEKNGTVTTIISDAMYERGVRGDEA